MKRLVLKLTVLVLTFGLGLGVSVLWQDYAHRVPAEPVSSTPSGLPLQLLYVDACGGSVYTRSFELPEGGQIAINCYYFSTEAAAEAMLDGVIARSSEIVESSEKGERDGRRVGRTIVVAGPTVERFSTFGKAFCKTRASSLEALRSFENSTRSGQESPPLPRLMPH